MTRLYRQDPTLPDPPEEQRDEQRLREMWPEFEALAKAEFALREAVAAFGAELGGDSITVQALSDFIADDKIDFFEDASSSLEGRDPIELVEQFYQDVYRTISSPESRIKQANAAGVKADWQERFKKWLRVGVVLLERREKEEHNSAYWEGYYHGGAVQLKKAETMFQELVKAQDQ